MNVTVIKQDAYFSHKMARLFLTQSKFPKIRKWSCANMKVIFGHIQRVKQSKDKDLALKCLQNIFLSMAIVYDSA